jgi:hypothetical protein
MNVHIKGPSLDMSLGKYHPVKIYKCIKAVLVPAYFIELRIKLPIIRLTNVSNGFHRRQC